MWWKTPYILTRLERKKRCERCEKCEYLCRLGIGNEHPVWTRVVYCDIEREVPEYIEVCPKEYLD